MDGDLSHYAAASFDSPYNKYSHYWCYNTVKTEPLSKDPTQSLHAITLESSWVLHKWGSQCPKPGYQYSYPPYTPIYKYP